MSSEGSRECCSKGGACEACACSPFACLCRATICLITAFRRACVYNKLYTPCNSNAASSGRAWLLMEPGHRASVRTAFSPSPSSVIGPSRMSADIIPSWPNGYDCSICTMACTAVQQQLQHRCTRHHDACYAMQCYAMPCFPYVCLTTAATATMRPRGASWLKTCKAGAKPINNKLFIFVLKRRHIGTYSSRPQKFCLGAGVLP